MEKQTIEKVTKISEDVIEVTKTVTSTVIEQLNRNVLVGEKTRLQERINEINILLEKYVIL